MPNNNPRGWGDWKQWSVVEVYEPFNFGVQNMTDEEMVSALMSDLLALHFMGWTQGVSWDDFLRLIQTPEQEDRVFEAFYDTRVQGLTTGHEGLPKTIKLRPDHESLQQAMNIAGEWFEGFEVPAGVEVVSLSPVGMKTLARRIALQRATRSPIHVQV